MECWSETNDCLKVVCVHPIPLHVQDVTQGQFWAEFNRFEFIFFSSRPVAIAQLKEHSLLYYS